MTGTCLAKNQASIKVKERCKFIKVYQGSGITKASKEKSADLYIIWIPLICSKECANWPIRIRYRTDLSSNQRINSKVFTQIRFRMIQYLSADVAQLVVQRTRNA